MREVEDGSAAANADIREGDLIFVIGSHAIVEPDDVYDALGTADANGTLQVKLVRGADEMTVDVRFGETAGSAEQSGPIH